MNWKLGEAPDEELIKAFSLAFSTTFLKKDENIQKKRKATTILLNKTKKKSKKI